MITWRSLNQKVPTLNHFPIITFDDSIKGLAMNNWKFPSSDLCDLFLEPLNSSNLHLIINF